jgi:D-alanine transaminase
MPIREESFDRAFFIAADECFYTNSVRELVPIVRVDDHLITTGEPGDITTTLAQAYSAETPMD